MSGQHDDATDHGPEQGAVDWWHVLDVLVWVSAGIIAVIATEWLAGRVIRERLAVQASKYLKRTAETPTA